MTSNSSFVSSTAQLKTTEVREVLPISNQLLTVLKSPESLMLILSALALVGLSVMSDRRGKKGKLATAKFGGYVEKRAARKVALKQIRERKRSAVALYVGTPREKLLGSSDRQTIYLPHAQRGIAVSGGPGSGKMPSASKAQISSGCKLYVYGPGFKPSSNSSRSFCFPPISPMRFFQK